MVYGVNGNGNINPASIRKCFVNPNGVEAKPNVTTEKTSNAAPIKFTNNTVKRTNLDEMNPYAELGVKFTNKDPIDTICTAAPEFGNRWHGNFTLTEEGKDIFDKTCNLLAYICKNKGSVTNNLEESGIFKTMDQAFGIT